MSFFCHSTNMHHITITRFISLLSTHANQGKRKMGSVYGGTFGRCAYKYELSDSN